MTDADSIDTTGVRGSCGWCDGSLEPHHFVQVAGSSALALCSEACLRKKQQQDAATRAARLRRRLKWLVIGSSLVAACITPHDGPLALRKPVTIAKAPAPSEAEPLPGSFGPEWPPSEASLIAELGHDAWIHPLAGPFRRMPARDSRVFGAERPGDRPIDCRKGHCGVDLGGEIWGEQVRAAHDGVVDRVQRAANDAHGGHYVRIAHHNGTVFTQYFHLAAVASWVEAGVPVKAGDIVGLLGDTGVKESSPHLHFTVSVRPAPSWPEQYVDPEPLIALWPLRIPLADSPIVLISTEGRPGVPLGGAPAGSRKAAKAKRPRAPTKSDKSDDSDGERALPSAPADDAPGTESSE